MTMVWLELQKNLNTKMKLGAWIIVCITSIFHTGNSEDACVFSMKLTDMDRHEFTSSGYPNTYPENTECTWQIDVEKFQENKSIRLDFLDVDIEESQDCSSEHIKIYSSSNDELGVMCGHQQKKYTFFIDSVLIVFKTGNRGTQTRKGFKMVYHMLNDSACTGIYNVNESGSIANTDEGSQYRSFQRCVYHLRHISSQGVIQLTMSQVSPATFDCDREYVLVYDGETESSPLMMKWCGSQNEIFFSPDFLVVIVSSRHPLKIRTAFNDVPCHFTWFVSVQELTKVSFNGTSNTTCVWTVRSFSTSLWIQVNLEYADISCPESQLVIYGGAKRWSYCGNQARIYLATAPMVVIASLIAEATEPQPVFFQTHSKLVATADCVAGRVNRIADETERTLESPLYPSRYPSYLNCVWELRAPDAKDIIDISVTEIDLGDDCQDSISIYNGAIYDFDTTLPDMVICGINKTNTTLFKSNGGFVTVHFVTDGPIGGTGFKLSFMSPFQNAGSPANLPTLANTGVIAAVVVVVVIVVIIITFVTVIGVCYFRKKKSAELLPHIPVHVTMNSLDPSEPSRSSWSQLGGTSNPAYSEAPPTTQDQPVPSGNQWLPPSYSEAEIKDSQI